MPPRPVVREPTKGTSAAYRARTPGSSGYWIPSGAPEDKPVGNLGRDLPDFALPFTAACAATHRYNVEHTIDPAALCIASGLRQNANGLPFQIVQSLDHMAFLYWINEYRIVPFDGRKHEDSPEPSFFGDEIGSWHDSTFVIDSATFKTKKTWADENANTFRK
jgi:hypothetical protein